MTTLQQLENLVKIGTLKIEKPNKKEFDGLLKSGTNRLTDVTGKDLNLDSRFDLAYNASHSLSLAALRWHGYRSQNRGLKREFSTYPPSPWRPSGTRRPLFWTSRRSPCAD